MKLKIINLIELAGLIFCILYIKSWKPLLLIPFILLVNYFIYTSTSYWKIYKSGMRDEYNTCRRYYKELIKQVLKWFTFKAGFFILFYTIICQVLISIYFYHRYSFISAVAIVGYLMADLVLIIPSIMKYKLMILVLKLYFKANKYTRLYFLEFCKKNINWDNRDTLAKAVSGNRIALEYTIDEIKAHEKGWV